MEAAMAVQVQAPQVQQAMGAQGAAGQGTAAETKAGGALSGGMFAALLQQMLGIGGETALLNAGPQQKATLVEKMRQQLEQDGADMGMQLLAEMLAVNPMFVQQTSTAELAELMQPGTQQGGIEAMQALGQNAQQWAALGLTDAQTTQMPQVLAQMLSTAGQETPQNGAQSMQSTVPTVAQLIQQATGQSAVVQQTAATGGETQQELSGEAQFTRALFTAQQTLTKSEGSDAAEVLAQVAGDKSEDKKLPENAIPFPQQTRLEQLSHTAELSKLENIDAKDLMQQIKTGVQNGLGEGKNEFILKLKPEGLGEITVRMLETAGKITLSMTTANTQTQRLLNNELAALRDAVRPYNVEVQHVESQNTQHFDLQQQRQSFAQQQQQQQHHETRHNRSFQSYESYEQAEAQTVQQYAAAGLNTVV